MNLKSGLFFTATAAIAACGWIIAFGGALALKSSGYLWWTIIYHFFLIIGVALFGFSSLVKRYRFTFLALIAIGLMMLIIAVDSTIYSRLASEKAMGAGYIIQAIILFTWIFGFGKKSSSTIHHFQYHNQPVPQPAVVNSTARTPVTN
ncbi:hypothetical protein K493DRAFT_361463 [Basidiobolus meristosporus CBS 931.73]|uniref:Uncharacterized protein n=1 Tax=Basidiobolus meristosporus CBS 931.73 TaxID=1314790 RepID=A0A1Y1X9K2_9FUNG|nr:hypothetical protein K493DRAFT_361463 [Basidiobolus meristosporus CBS 931.73]|eukprot:ORX82399.1 hypothetical protein K493DRAFT_361463 [Basidiobolus meristosporus CBS 931.73]